MSDIADSVMHTVLTKGSPKDYSRKKIHIFITQSIYYVNVSLIILQKMFHFIFMYLKEPFIFHFQCFDFRKCGYGMSLESRVGILLCIALLYFTF